MRDLGFWVVVDAALSVDVGDLLVETALACTDLSDPFEEFVEIIFAEFFALFESFVVENESFDNEFAEGFGRPDSEAGGFYGIDAVADGDDGVEVVKIYLAGDLSGAFGLNYSKYSNS